MLCCAAAASAAAAAAAAVACATAAARSAAGRLSCKVLLFVAASALSICGWLFRAVTAVSMLGSLSGDPLRAVLRRPEPLEMAHLLASERMLTCRTFRAVLHTL